MSLTDEREAEHEARLDKAYATIGRLLVEGDMLRAIITMIAQDLDLRSNSPNIDSGQMYASSLLGALERRIEDYGVSLERRT